MHAAERLICKISNSHSAKYTRPLYDGFQEKCYQLFRMEALFNKKYNRIIEFQRSYDKIMKVKLNTNELLQ